MFTLERLCQQMGPEKVFTVQNKEVFTSRGFTVLNILSFC
jgi:hypothetical protein